MTEEIHASVHAIWYEFIAENIEFSRKPMPESWHFGITKQDADNCVFLIKAGIKTAASMPMESYLNYETAIPADGDLAIITDWDGVAHCIIQTKNVEIIPFNEVSEEHALNEGEGDQTLAYWKKVHWEFFSKDLNSFGAFPEEDMMVVCETFEMIYSK